MGRRKGTNGWGCSVHVSGHLWYLDNSRRAKGTHKLPSKSQRHCRRFLSGAVFFWNIISCARYVFSLIYWEVQCSLWHFLHIQIHLQFFLPIKCKKTARIKTKREGERQLAAKLTKCLKSSQRKGKFHYFISLPFLQTSPFLRYFSILLVDFSSSILSVQQPSLSFHFLMQTVLEHYNACFTDLAVS